MIAALFVETNGCYYGLARMSNSQDDRRAHAAIEQAERAV